jgi:hypothetical protein
MFRLLIWSVLIIGLHECYPHVSVASWFKFGALVSPQTVDKTDRFIIFGLGCEDHVTSDNDLTCNLQN